LTLKIGQASPHLLDNISIKHNNQKLKIKHLAHINIIKPNTIIINPWDKISLKIIEKAILEDPTHFVPKNDGNQILIKIPELNKQDRLKTFKELKVKGEGIKILIRKNRRDANTLIKKSIKSKNLSSNSEKKNLSIVQKLTSSATNKIENMIEAKKNDIINV